MELEKLLFDYLKESPKHRFILVLKKHSLFWVKRPNLTKYKQMAFEEKNSIVSQARKTC